MFAKCSHAHAWAGLAALFFASAGYGQVATSTQLTSAQPAEQEPSSSAPDEKKAPVRPLSIVEISRRNTDLYLKTLDRDNAKIDKEMADLRNGGRTGQNGGAPIGYPTTQVSATPAPTPPPAPVVRSVSGSGDKLYATLLYADGSTKDARAGDTVPGGYRILAVTLDKVSVTRSGQTTDLGFASVPPAQAQTQQGSGSFLMPGIMPSAQPYNGIR